MFSDPITDLIWVASFSEAFRRSCSSEAERTHTSGFPPSSVSFDSMILGMVSSLSRISSMPT